MTDKIDFSTMENPETFVPEHMRDGYERYFEFGISPGSFGMAIINLDEAQAKNRADHINIHHIETQIEWMKKYSPQHQRKGN